MGEGQDRLEEELRFLGSRPDRSGKQARVVRRLDSAVPGWEEFVRGSAFKEWLREVNSKTGIDRATMFLAMWERRDQDSLAILLRLYQEQKAGKRPPLGSQLAGCRFQVGELVADNYEIVDKLGAGGFGQVFLVLAHNDEEFDWGALKLLRADRIVDAHTRLRFEKEARILISLRAHPHLVSPQYIERLGDSWAIISQFVLPDEQGRLTLADHLASEPIAAERRAEIIAQACAGLASAYRDGVAAHRDIKPANLLIDPQGKVRVMDFGMASVKGSDSGPISSTPTSRPSLDHLTQVGSTFGTPAYMAPEQFIDPRTCDERSDIYSLGVTLYEMSVGKLPFAPRGDFSQFARLHITCPPPPIHSRLWPVIERCLAKDPTERFQSVSELAEELKRLCEACGWPVPVAQAEIENTGRVIFDDLMLRGIAFSRMDEHAKAIELYLQAAEILDLSHEVWVRLGFSYNELQLWDKALEAFSHSSTESRDAVEESWVAFTHFHRSDSRAVRATALQHYRAAAEKDPRLMQVWSMIARCELSLDRPVEALEALTVCAALPNSGIDVWIRKARLELQQPSKLADAIRSRDVIERARSVLTSQEDGALREINKGIAAQTLASEFLQVLGPGFTRTHAAAIAKALVEEDVAGRLNAVLALTVVRGVNPAVLHSQAEKLFAIVQKYRRV